MQEPLADHILEEVLAPAGAVCLQHNLPTVDRVIVYFAFFIECMRICQETNKCAVTRAPFAIMLQAW